MTQLLADMLPAAMLGLFVAIPFGPICLMCVQRTLALGIWFGIASGMGAAVAHGLFSFLAEASAAVLAQTALTCRCRCALREGSPSSSWASEPASSPPARRAKQDAETCALPSCRRC